MSFPRSRTKLLGNGTRQFLVLPKRDSMELNVHNWFVRGDVGGRDASKQLQLIPPGGRNWE